MKAAAFTCVLVAFACVLSLSTFCEFSAPRQDIAPWEDISDPAHHVIRWPEGYKHDVCAGVDDRTQAVALIGLGLLSWAAMCVFLLLGTR